MSLGYARTVARLSIVSALAISLGACGSMSLGNFGFGGSSEPAPAAEPGVEPEMPATVRSEELVGKWGLASYQNPADRPRTEIGRASCRERV